MDLLKKNIFFKIKDLALTISNKIDNTDYKGWSKQINMFVYNLQNHVYYTKLNATKQNTTSGYQPTLLNNNTSALTPQNDLIDLDTIKFSSGSSGLPNNI